MTSSSAAAAAVIARKNKIALLCAFLFWAGFAGLMALGEYFKWTRVQIDDVAHSQTVVTEKLDHETKRIFVEIVGEIDGRARLKTSWNGDVHMIGPGIVDLEFAEEFYAVQGRIAYEPIDVTTGEITIKTAHY